MKFYSFLEIKISYEYDELNVLINPLTLKDY